MTKRLFLSICLLLCCSGLLLSSCATIGTSTTQGAIQAGPGVDLHTKTITLGILAPYSGPLALAGIPTANAIKAFFDRVNDQGGIDGFKVKFLEGDTKYDPQTEVRLYNQIHHQVLMIASSVGTQATFAINNLATQDQMLVFATTFSSALARQKDLILLGTPYRLRVENAFEYLVNTLHVKSPATGIIYQNDGYGQDGLTGYNEAVAAYHLHDVGQAPYGVTDTDFTAQVSKMKAAGARYVFLNTAPPATASILSTAASLGYSPQWILQSAAFTKSLLAVPALVPLLSKAWMVSQGAIWGDRSVPAMAQMLKDLAAYYPDQRPDPTFESGYASAYITYAILKGSLEDKNLTRAGLFNVFQSLDHVDLGGLFPAVTYGSSPNQRVPSRDSMICRIDPAATTGITPMTPDFTGIAAQRSQF